MEVLAFLSMNAHTFDKYAERFGLKGEKVGRNVYYNREDVLAFDNTLADGVESAIKYIERKTGKKVQLV